LNLRTRDDLSLLLMQHRHLKQHPEAICFTRLPGIDNQLDSGPDLIFNFHIDEFQDTGDLDPILFQVVGSLDDGFDSLVDGPRLQLTVLPRVSVRGSPPRLHQRQPKCVMWQRL